VAVNDFVQVVTTTELQEDARRIADLLVEKCLAACVQIVGPVTSVYRWKGKVESAQEWQCLIKTRQDLLDDVSDAIREIHPYEVPEIVAVPIVAGSRDYLTWLEEQTTKPG
jgi:periplasmic divalent cation tolerance protein